MHKRIWYTAMGLLVVGIVLAGLLSVIDTLAGTPPLTVSKPSMLQLDPGGSANLDKVDLLKDITPELPSLPHTPLFEVVNSAATSLLRSTATLNYEGNLWNFQASSAVQDYTGDKIKPPVMGYSRKITSDVTVNTLQDFGKGTNVLPTSLYPVSVDSPIPLTYLPEDQLFISKQGLPESYSFRSVTYQFDKATLENAEVAQDDKYLQLPSEITERLRQLARDITAGIESPYQKAQAIENYLKENYAYDFEYRPAPDGQEPNDWFLFEEKKGVCTNFNSAFVVLARSSGLPSRLVGGYAIKPGVAMQTVYADQAHAWSEVEFQNIGWQTFDATGNPPDLVPTVTEITSVDNTVIKGNTFYVQGTVTSTATTVEGVLVEIFINPTKTQEGGIEVGKGTVNTGRFNIEAKIPAGENVGNYQLLAHARKSIRFQESWSDPRIKVTAETRINLEIPGRIKLNDTLQVKGTLIETTDIPVGGKEIEITVNTAPATRVTTDQYGRFNWQNRFGAPGRYTLDTIFADTEFFAGARKQASVFVLQPTVITLHPPDKGRVSEDVTLNGTLVEDITLDGVQGQQIYVFVNNERIEKEVFTDNSGNFTFQQAFVKPGLYQVEVVSDFTDQYWESRHTSAIEIIPVERQFPWFYFILTMIVLAGGVGLYFLYTWTKSRVAAATGPAGAMIEPPVLPVNHEDNTPKPVIKIMFPMIDNPFPDVWGINDELKIIFELFDTYGQSIAGGDLEIEIKDRNARLSTDTKGFARLLMTFSEKAVYGIEAAYAGADGKRGVTTTRSIKIVDYREEIVELFRSLKNWFTEKGLSFPLDATPRDIQEIVAESKLRIPPDVLARLIEYFEEADYSLHPVERENFLRMYLVQRKVREYGQ